MRRSIINIWPRKRAFIFVCLFVCNKIIFFSEFHLSSSYILGLKFTSLIVKFCIAKNRDDTISQWPFSGCRDIGLRPGANVHTNGFFTHNWTLSSVNKHMKTFISINTQGIFSVRQKFVEKNRPLIYFYSRHAIRLTENFTIVLIAQIQNISDFYSSVSIIC